MSSVSAEFLGQNERNLSRAASGRPQAEPGQDAARQPGLGNRSAGLQPQQLAGAGNNQAVNRSVAQQRSAGAVPNPADQTATAGAGTTPGASQPQPGTPADPQRQQPLGMRKVKAASALRQTPSTSAPILAPLEPGAELEVFEQRQTVDGLEWILARKEGQTGYVPTQRLTYAQRQTTGGVALRRQPGQEGGGSQVPPRATVVLLSDKRKEAGAEWIRIGYGREQGWVKTSELGMLQPQTAGAGGYQSVDLNRFLTGGSQAPAAIIVGTSEGTRTASGGKTWAYEAHTDPGNGVTNQGSFSYQHGARNGEEADEKQLARLRQQTPAFEAAARRAGLDPGHALLASAFYDLFTQSPEAATAPDGGFLSQLPTVARKGGPTYENILAARIEAYRIPGTNRCGGFGGDWEKLRQDQARRMDALVSALKTQGYQQAGGPPGSGQPPLPGGEPVPAGAAALSQAIQGRRLIKRGAKGPEVRELQELLGLPPEEQDADFGPATEEAVRAFQRQHQLTEDGVVGPQTLQALLKGGGGGNAQNPQPQRGLAQAIAAGRVFGRGDEGAEVKELQQLLGMSQGGQTGKFGETTEQVVRKYQEAHGLDVDGRVGPATYGALTGQQQGTGTGTGGGGGAARLLNHRNVSFSFGRGDTQGDHRSSAYQNLVDAAAGKPGWTSRRSDVGARQVRVSPKLIDGLLKCADAGYAVRINFILGGDHSSRSHHYYGEAVDLDPNGHYSAMKRIAGAGGDTQNEGTHYHFAFP